MSLAQVHSRASQPIGRRLGRSAARLLGEMLFYAVLLGSMIGCTVPSHRFMDETLPMAGCTDRESAPGPKDANSSEPSEKATAEPDRETSSAGEDRMTPPAAAPRKLAAGSITEPTSTRQIPQPPPDEGVLPAPSASAETPDESQITDDCTDPPPPARLRGRLGRGFGWPRQPGSLKRTVHEIPPGTADHTVDVPRPRFHPVPTRPVFEPGATERPPSLPGASFFFAPSIPSTPPPPRDLKTLPSGSRRASSAVRLRTGT